MQCFLYVPSGIQFLGWTRASLQPADHAYSARNSRRPSMAIAMSSTSRRPKRRPAFVCSVGMAAGASGWRQCAWTVIWYTILTLPRVDDYNWLAAAEIMLICSNSDRSAVSGLRRCTRRTRFTGGRAILYRQNKQCLTSHEIHKRQLSQFIIVKSPHLWSAVMGKSQLRFDPIWRFELNYKDSIQKTTIQCKIWFEIFAIQFE